MSKINQKLDDLPHTIKLEWSTVQFIMNPYKPTMKQSAMKKNRGSTK